jgi:hypothetical protein
VDNSSCIPARDPPNANSQTPVVLADFLGFWFDAVKVPARDPFNLNTSMAEISHFLELTKRQ